MRKPWAMFSLAAVPAAIFACAAYEHSIARHFYSPFRFDPDYSYLFNSLNIARFQCSKHLGHPGTPVQILGALIVRAVSLFRPGFFPNDLYAQPELYLSWINHGLLALLSGAWFCVGAMIYRGSGSLATALLFQALAVISPSTFLSFDRVSPETFLLAASGVQVSLALGMAFEWFERRKLVLGSALVSAFGMATKITFFPLVLLPLFFLSGFAEWGIYLALSSAVFLAFLIPIACSLNRFVSLTFGLLNHMDFHASAHPGFSPALLMGHFLRILTLDPVTSLLALVALVLVARVMLRPGRSALKKLAAAVIACVALDLIVVLKEEGDPTYLLHFFMPIQVLIIGWIAAIFYRETRQAWFAWFRQWTVVGMLIVFGLFGWMGWGSAREELQTMGIYRDQAEQVEKAALETRCRWHLTNRVGQASALIDGLAFGYPQDAWPLQRLHPYDVIYDGDEDAFLYWYGRIRFDEIPIHPGECLSLATKKLDPSRSIFRLPGYDLKLLTNPDWEYAAYAITPRLSRAKNPRR